MLGELPAFHETHGYYAQGVSITTATLPRGWRNRLILVETASTAPGRGHCLDPHDCVTSKLLAGREKDFAFAAALIREHLIDPAILSDRVALLDDAHPVAMERVIRWLSQYPRT